MKNTIKVFCILGLVMFLSSGCIKTKEAAEEKPKEVEVVKMDKISDGQMPADVQLVLAAILNKVNGEKKKANKVRNVWFTKKGKHSISKDFNYKGFLPVKYRITGHEAVQVSKKKVQTRMDGLLLLQDEFDRRAGFYFSVEYTSLKKGIVITKSSTAPISTHSPRIEAYIVRKSDFDATPKGSLNSYIKLYTFALEKAVPPVSTKSKAGKKGIEDEFLFIVFCKDRLLDDSILTMKVTAKAKMKGDSLIEPIVLSDEGFRFFIGAGKFNTAKKEHKFHIGVKYTPDPTDETKSVLLADFTNIVK